MSKPYTLSKSRLMAWRQCPRKLWLTVNRPELIEYDAAAKARFEQGDKVGAIARQLYGPGPVLDIRMGADVVVRETARLVAAGAERIYEAAFIYEGILVLADVLERVGDPPYRYRIVEVKSSTSVKDVHREDSSVQAVVIARAGLSLESVVIAHIDNGFVYPGEGRYKGLLAEESVDATVQALRAEIPGWIVSANAVLFGAEPETQVGAHCNTPHECPFQGHCSTDTEREYPVTLLPRGGAVAQKLIEDGFFDLRDVPESRLEKDLHRRVWRATHSGDAYVDPALSVELRQLPFPHYYLDFETIAFAVPIWPGTRPYQALPFQWSLHIEHGDGRLEHRAFLDTDGAGPMRSCMSDLIAAIGSAGPVIVYSGYEGVVLRAMSDFLPDLAPQLGAICGRLFDLLPLVRQHYYHPAQKGSWSIKKVLPSIAPELSYEGLAVGDGNAAQVAYLEMIDTATAAERRAELRGQLLEYCGQDTLAMVRITNVLSRPPGTG